VKRPRLARAVQARLADLRLGRREAIDSARNAIVVRNMLDRFILPILVVLIVLYTAVLAWANRRDPPKS
jgi:hypothetical protein